MSELFLIRHGQASFGADDYDKLSELGHEQAGILCDYWHSLGYRFDQICFGTLNRQRSTAECLLERIETGEPLVLSGLDEFVSHDVIDAYREQYAISDGFEVAGKTHTLGVDDPRWFQRFIGKACERWVNNELDSPQLEPFPLFKGRVCGALQEIMSANAKGRRVVVVTSAGVIAMAVQSVLGMPDQEAVKLNWAVYNTSLTRIPFSGSRKSLSMFNAIPHLERPGYTDKITYR